MKSISHYLQKLSERQRKLFLIFSYIVTTGMSFALPVHNARASFWDLDSIGNSFASALIGFFINLLSQLVLAILTTVLAVMSFILKLIAMLAGAFTDAAINLMLSVPYTPANSASAGSIITIGWSIMRDLANISLIFVLVAIAVSTILNLGTDRWRKLIIPFIGIALLINFTPVITGLVIDITNILTKIFFQASAGGWMLFFSPTNSLQYIWDSITAIFGGGLEKSFGIFLQAIFDIIFSVLSIAAFVVMSLIILARILALWLLVILSPLAFVAYILPETRRYFSQWWHNFFQWAILPVPLGLFYWLAASFIASGATFCSKPNFFAFTVPNAGGSLGAIADPNKVTFLDSGTMCTSIFLLFAIATLFVGFMISFSFSAAGSGVIMKNTQRLGGWAQTKGKALGKFSAGRAGRLGVRGARRAAPYAPRIAAGMLGMARRKEGVEYGDVTKKYAGKIGEKAASYIPGSVKQKTEQMGGMLGNAGGQIQQQAQRLRETELGQKAASIAGKTRDLAKAAPEKAIDLGAGVAGAVLTPEEQRKVQESVLATLGQARAAEIKKEYGAIKAGKYTDDQLRQFMRTGSDAQRSGAKILLNSDNRNFSKLSDQEKQRAYQQAKQAGLENDLLLQNNDEYDKNLKLLIPDSVERSKKRGELSGLMAREVNSAEKGMTVMSVEDLKRVVSEGKTSDVLAASRQLANKKEFYDSDPALQESLLNLARANDQETFILKTYLHKANAALGEIDKTLKAMKPKDLTNVHEDLFKPENHNTVFMPVYTSKNLGPKQWEGMMGNKTSLKAMEEKMNNPDTAEDMKANDKVFNYLKKFKRSGAPLAL